MTVLITGASAGFGEAMCRTFVRAGFRVVGAARRMDKLQGLRDELGGSFYPLELDLTDRPSVAAALASVETPNAERSTTAAVDNFMLVFLFNLLTFFIIGTIKLKNRLVIINDKKCTLALLLKF